MNRLSDLEQQLLHFLKLRDAANRLTADQVDAVGYVLIGTAPGTGWTRAAIVAHLQGRVDVLVGKLEMEGQYGALSQVLHHLRMEGVLCMPAVIG